MGSNLCRDDNFLVRTLNKTKKKLPGMEENNPWEGVGLHKDVSHHKMRPEIGDSKTN